MDCPINSSITISLASISLNRFKFLFMRIIAHGIKIKNMKNIKIKLIFNMIKKLKNKHVNKDENVPGINVMYPIPKSVKIFLSILLNILFNHTYYFTC